MTQRYLTTNELAERLRTSPSTVRYWRHAGRGPRGTKIGRRVLYEESDVEQWVQQRRETEARSRR